MHGTTVKKSFILVTCSVQYIMILERNNCQQLVQCVMWACGDDPVTKNVFIILVLCFVVLG